MKIQSMSIQGVKGVYTEWSPSALTLLVGPNGAGKTGRLLALPFALHGYTPLGRTAEATASLSPNGQGMSVRVKLDDGFGWRRGIVKDPVKRSFSEEITIDGRESLKLAAAGAVISERVGDFTAALSISEFTSLSADRRRQFILSLCSDAGGSTAGLMTRLEMALLAEVIGDGQVWTFCRATFKCEPRELDDSQRQELVDRLWPTVDQRIQDAWMEISGQCSECVASDLVATVQAWTDRAKELKSIHRAAKEGALKAIERLMIDKNALVVVAEHVEELRRRIHDLTCQLGEVNRSIGAADQRLMSARMARDLADAALNRLAHAQSELAHDEDCLANRDWQAELERLRADQKAAERQDPGAAEDAVALAETELAAISRERTDLAERIGSAHRELERYQERLWASRDRIQACQASAWVQCWSLVHEIRADGPESALNLAQLTQIIDTQARSDREAIESLEFFVLELEAKSRDLERVISERGVHLGVAEERLKVARSDRDNAVQALANVRAMNGQALQIQEQIRLVEKERAALTSRVARLRDDVYRLTREHAEAQAHADMAASGDAVDVQALTAQRDRLKAGIRETEEHVRQKERAAALEQELALCIGRSEQEKVMYDLASKLANAVKTIRETLLADLVRPLLGRIDAFLSAAGLEARSYCDLATDRGRAVFELGWIVEDADGTERKIVLDTMSGGESALFGAGLAYALAVLSGSPLKVLTLEADTLDEANLGRLLDAFTQVADDLDHVVVATSRPVRSAPAAWDMVRLGSTEAVNPREVAA